MSGRDIKLESSAAQRSHAEKEQPAATKLAELRELAQKHLDEIDGLTKVEQMQEKKRIEELESEVRRKAQRQQKRSPDGKEQSEGKRPKMRTAQDVLDRLRWDPSLRMEEHRVGYIDRFGGIQELPVSQWIRESTDEDWIPQHRIRYFKRVIKVGRPNKDQKMEEDVVWHRDQRIDQIFGYR